MVSTVTAQIKHHEIHQLNARLEYMTIAIDDLQKKSVQQDEKIAFLEAKILKNRRFLPRINDFKFEKLRYASSQIFFAGTMVFAFWVLKRYWSLWNVKEVFVESDVYFVGKSCEGY